MFYNHDKIDVIQRFRDNRDINKLPVGYVPSYDYFLIDNNKFIGIINIRINLTERLLKYGGILEDKVINTDAGETFLTRRYWIKL